MTKKVIVRVVGGLGNQMFCYAAARRLAFANDAELVLDTVTGFQSDPYNRSYQLNVFAIAGREATAGERLEPFPKPRRALLRAVSKAVPYDQRPYIQQEGLDFDARLLSRAVKGTVRIEGVWPGEGYFRDIEEKIRSEFVLKHPPHDPLNLELSARISAGVSVGMHVRWFDMRSAIQNVSAEFYRRAAEEMKARLANPHFFVFSDNPEAAREALQLRGDVTYVAHNDPDSGGIADFWLLRQCDHFVIANSTFSWWAAWLGAQSDKIVICPDPTHVRTAGWAAKGFVPENWLTL
jgi:hypothetical protein